MTVEYGWISGKLVSRIKVEFCKAVGIVMGGWWVVFFLAVRVHGELIQALHRWLPGALGRSVDCNV